MAEGWIGRGNVEEALRIYQEMLEIHQAKAFEPFLLLRIGKLQQHLGRWDDARSSLETVIRQFPQSEEAIEAKGILETDAFFFTVQVGAFLSRSNALRLQAELKRLGYPAEVDEVTLQGRVFHRVRVGRFSRRSEAEEQAEALHQHGFPSKIFP
jgi:tetratricopeptide (TPR) repeat protein